MFQPPSRKRKRLAHGDSTVSSAPGSSTVSSAKERDFWAQIVSDKDRQIEELRKERDALVQIATNQQQTEDLRKERDNLVQIATDQHKQIQQFTRSVEDKDRQIQQLTQDAACKSSRIEELEREICTTRDALAKAEHDFELLKSVVGKTPMRMLNRIRELETRIRELETQRREQDEFQLALETDLAAQEQALEALKKERANAWVVSAMCVGLTFYNKVVGR